MKQYFYAEGENQLGPFSLEELSKKKITKETLIWFEGIDNWTKASEIEDLKPILKSIPPPLVISPLLPPKVNNQIENSFVSSNKKFIKILIVGGVFGVFLILFILVLNGNDTNKQEDKLTTVKSNINTSDPIPSNPVISNEVNPKSDINETDKKIIKKTKKEPTEEELRYELFEKESSNPIDYIGVSYSWKVNLAANTIIEGDIYNNASIAGYKNITILVKFYSKTDVFIGQEKFTVMEFVPPGSSVSFRHKISGWWSDVTNSKYRIISAEPYY